MYSSDPNFEGQWANGSLVWPVYFINQQRKHPRSCKDLAVNGVRAFGLNKIYDYETDSFQILLPLIASLTVHGRSHSLSLSKTTACLYKKDFM